MSVRTRGWCIVLLLMVTELWAQETSPPSSVLTLELGTDSADSREAYLDLDLGFENGLRLRGMAGASRQESGTETYDTRSRLAGISSDYSAAFVAGFDYEYWGDEQLLETRTRRIKFGANTADWYFQLSYEIRTTRFYTNGRITLFNGREIPLPDSAEIDSTGTGLSISNYSFYPWAISLSYIEYSYDSFANGRTVSDLADSQIAARIFSLSTLGMAIGLEAWRRSGDLSYNFEWGAAGVNGSQSESAVDRSLASNGAVYVMLDMGKQWSLTLTAGQFGADNSSETVTYGRGAIAYRW